MDLDRIYRTRFAARDAMAHDALWRAIARHLASLMPAGPVLEVACDRGAWVRATNASERWGLDARDVAAELGPDIQAVQADASDLASFVPQDHFAAVLVSNFLEHLSGPDAVVAMLSSIRTVLRPGGRVFVINPNIALIGGRYYDFLDHHVALTDRSLLEAASLAGFHEVRTVRRFLPYTTRAHLPTTPILVRAYLALPPALRPFAGQTLYVGER